MRAREFLMKDAYSFHTSRESLQETYDAMFAAYKRIFTRLGLDFRAVIADSGSIGGTGSHEFHVLSESGEDLIAYSDGSDYAANLEKAEALLPSVGDGTVVLGYTIIHVINQNHKILLCADGDTLNDVKIANYFSGADFKVLNDFERKNYMADISSANYLPEIIADNSLLHAEEVQLTVDSQRTFNFSLSEHKSKDRVQFAALRNVRDGDRSPDGKGALHLVRGIEVGHVFQLGDKYTAAMGANVLGQDGKNSPLLSGCYGIGVSRVVAAAIEQKHDERGIIWSAAMAPYQIIILPLLWHKSFRVKELAEKLYADLTAKGYEVMLDDRKERAGVMFSTAELIGIPHTLVISEKGIEAGQIEYNQRATNDKENIAVDKILEFIAEKVCMA
jgi:prolyl-tRNA synthetase